MSFAHTMMHKRVINKAYRNINEVHDDLMLINSSISNRHLREAEEHLRKAHMAITAIIDIYK